MPRLPFLCTCRNIVQLYCQTRIVTLWLHHSKLCSFRKQHGSLSDVGASRLVRCDLCVLSGSTHVREQADDRIYDGLELGRYRRGV